MQIFLLVLVSFFENEPSDKLQYIDREWWPFFRESHVTQREEKDYSQSRSKISPAKGKEKAEKRASWKRKNEKSNGCTLRFYSGCFGDSL